jgi:Ca2+-binding EF-hand superfamily protein
MTTHHHLLVLAVATVGAAAWGCNREESQPTTAAPTPTPTPTAEAESARKADTSAATTPGPTPSLVVSGVGSCEPAAEVSGMLSRISETADSNGNGKIEKEEAYSAADFLVGGFFFRADKNFDGTLTPDEGRAARTELMTRSPMLATVMQRASTAENSAALAKMADLLGIDYDKAVSSSELREAGRQVVDELFRLGDLDKNGSLTQDEALQAGRNQLRSLGSRAFLAYDADGDKTLVLDEFQAALKESSRLAFRAADSNQDGKLTESEISNAVRGVAQRVWLPSEEPIKAADAKNNQP